LPMDFMNDSAVFTINNQYMLGPSIMVCPVIQPMYYHRNNVKINTTDYTRVVYLPRGSQWIDFWTGKRFDGGQDLKADASYETMPLLIRAGSIIPMGPFIQYSTEKSDPIEIRIYPGADGEFTLYEDETDNYNYDKGSYSTIPFSWEDAKNTLTIGDRIGSFPGMLNERQFNIVWVSQSNGIGLGPVEKYDKAVVYDGKKVVMQP
jgi:alpha-D-xyloside xylohydrolase